MSNRYIVRNTVYLLGIIGVLLITACNDTKKEIINPSVTSTTEVIEKEAPLFSAVSSDQSGIKFNNFNIENQGANYYHYEYFYNGGGVATADFNNDGLLDVVLTANMAPNRLYINKGDLKFEDVTPRAGINSKTADWCTGVTVIDINKDGFQDIFISRAGWFKDTEKSKLTNLLFINNGDLR